MLFYQEWEQETDLFVPWTRHIKDKRTIPSINNDNKRIMEIEKSTTWKRTKWIHSHLSFKEINIISISISNLRLKIKFNKLKKV